MSDTITQRLNILLIGGVWHFAPYRITDNNLNVPKKRFERADKLIEFCNKHRLSVSNKHCLIVAHASKLKY